MKAVLISIQPEWCDEIVNGRNTIEVRKTTPKIEMPFKCYIYQTKKGTSDKNGKVIGEFICDRIYTIRTESDMLAMINPSQLDMQSLLKYSNGKQLYGWHISKLKIYDEPKEISEFKNIKIIRKYHKCDSKNNYCININKLIHSDRVKVKYLEKAPQSWCYVEES